MLIRPLQASEAGEYKRTRLESLRSAPTSFSSSWETTAEQPDEFFVQRATFDSDNFLFGAFARNTLIGMCGGYVDAEVKRSHIAYVVSMWVEPESRGNKIAQKLLAAVLAQLCQCETTTSIQLSVTEGNVAALRIYEKFGFKTWGIEPAALLFEGKAYNEIHMASTPQAIKVNAAS